MNSPPSIPVLTGPTAVGKTDLAIELAMRMRAEIISIDSRQIFRGLDIATAKPSPEQLSRVRHHFVDELDPHEPLSAGVFARMAEERIAQILAGGRNVLLVGGSTLYLRALTEGLADIPHIDPVVRSELNKRLSAEGAQPLFDELQNADPDYAATLDVTKSQRIVRGLEVWNATGTPLSSYFDNRPPPLFSYDIIVLSRERSILYDRINKRVDQMLDVGLRAEWERVERLAPALTAATIGYREFSEYRDEAGESRLVSDMIKRNSRRYAKRQLTWYRSIPDAHWIDLASSRDVPGQILERIKRKLHHPDLVRS